MRLAPDPVGPDDTMIEVLALNQGPGPTVRTEAEAIAESGAAWPLLDDTPTSAVDEMPTRTTLPDLASLGDSSDQEEPGAVTSRGLGGPTSSGVAANDGFAAVDPGEAFLDLDIEFEELETPTDREAVLAGTDFPRERTERYDSIAPEDLGIEWLARATETPGQDELTPEEELDLRRFERMDTLEDISERPTDPAVDSADAEELIARGAKRTDSGPESGRS